MIDFCSTIGATRVFVMVDLAHSFVFVDSAIMFVTITVIPVISLLILPYSSFVNPRMPRLTNELRVS